MSNKCTANACVPPFCEVFGNIPDCGLVLVLPISLNQLYSPFYMAGLQIPSLINGISSSIESTIFWGILQIIIIWSLPYVISLIILCIILMRTRYIPFESGIILIVLLVVVDIISVFWVTQELINLGKLSYETGKNIINDNWNQNKTQIKCNLGTALFCPECIPCDIPK